MFKIPKNFRCPITSQIMIDPVFTSDGHTYEHEAIEEWLKTHGTSPKTGLTLANKQLTPNWDKKSDITDFLEQNAELYETEEIYLPKASIEQLLVAINNDQINVVKNLLSQERRLLVHDLKTQPITALLEPGLLEEPSINNKLTNSAESALPEDSLISSTNLLQTKNTAFYFASQFGSPELLNVILEQLQHTGQLQKQLAIPNPTDFNPVHLNALLEKTLEQNHNEKFILLLQLGADIEQPEVDTGNTLLHRMIIKGNKKAVELLLEYGAFLENRNLEDNTPLFLAVLHDHATLVQLLIANKAIITITCGTERLTPLHVAAKYGYVNIVNILLQANLYVDTTDIGGNTPLHLAAETNQENTIFLLLDAGAHHKARNYQDQTPLDIAKKNGQTKIVNLIKTTAKQIKQAKLEEMQKLIKQQANRIEQLERIFRSTGQPDQLEDRQPEQEPRKALVFFSQPETTQQEIIKFLRHVGFGEQDEAESILKTNRDLALVPSNFSDCAGRHFNQVTGFQYAVWALDWHMWSMLQKYIPIEATAAQLLKLDQEGINIREPGANSYQKNRQVSWENLIDALKKYTDNYRSWTNEERQNHWHQQVGKAQLLLPAHVINEYSRLDRSFYPCPSFNEVTLPRTSVMDWFNMKKGGTEAIFAWFRAYEKHPLAVDFCAIDPRALASMSKFDATACSTLYNIRTNQRAQLFASVTNFAEIKPTPSVTAGSSQSRSKPFMSLFSLKRMVGTIS